MSGKRIEHTDLGMDDDDIDRTLRAFTEVLRSERFLHGPQLDAFELEFAPIAGTKNVLGVASGTDAISLGLAGLGVGPGDEVIVPAFTAFPTAAAVTRTGATPVFVDVGVRLPHLDLTAALHSVTHRTKAVILVHLYGVAAPSADFVEAFDSLDIPVVEDCAQALGATLPCGRPVGSVGRFGAFSFYPTKNIGALGDAGAVATSDQALAHQVESWRRHGDPDGLSLHSVPAVHSRLGELQAAYLRTRLPSLASIVNRRRQLVAGYQQRLSNIVEMVDYDKHAAPHLAVVRVAFPDRLGAHLADRGIGTARHYSRALTDQMAYPADAGRAVPNAREWARTCLSLPLHLRLTDADIAAVADAISAWGG